MKKDFLEFVQNPSEITKELIKRVEIINNKYESILKSKVIIKRLKLEIKIRKYLYNDYINFYNFLKAYHVPEIITNNRIDKLEFLFKEFENFYEKVIFNNIALAYAYTKNKSFNLFIETIEDEKLIMLKKIFNKEICINKFKEKFGHHALNPYELSSKRFEEYSEDELIKIAELSSKIEIKEKIKLENYIQKGFKDVKSILIALRELGKDKSLLIIREIRKTLLELEMEYNINNIFNKSYSEILNLKKSN